MAGCIYGLDPGAASGALAWIDQSGKLIGFDNAEGADEALPLRLVERFRAVPADLLVVERPQSYGKGKSSVPALMGLAASAATAIAVARCLGIPVVQVQASQWKKAVGVTSDKQTSLDLADQLFGKRAWLAGRSKNKAGLVKADHNHAEAMLLAWYGLKLGAANG